jgi:hypothetical protein
VACIQRRSENPAVVAIGGAAVGPIWAGASGLAAANQSRRKALCRRKDPVPGYQILSYVLTRHTEFSVRGFRLAHFVLNGLAVAAFFPPCFSRSDAHSARYAHRRAFHFTFTNDRLFRMGCHIAMAGSILGGRPARDVQPLSCWALAPARWRGSRRRT